MEKIPVRVVWVKDSSGEVRSSVMVAFEEMMTEFSNEDYSAVRTFNTEYRNLIERGHLLMNNGRRKGRILSSTYWQLGHLLATFVENNSSNFRFLNYREAFQKDLKVTDSYIGVIMDFPRFFTKKEILDAIPMSYYFELLLKARALLSKNLLRAEKEKLKNLGQKGVLPTHKTYRKSLSDLRKIESDTQTGNAKKAGTKKLGLGK